MRKLFFILLIAVPSFFFSNVTPALWKMFMNSTSSSQSAKDLYAIANNFKEEQVPLLLGYKGISNILMCKHLLNPMNRISYFNEGKKWLELAIKKDSLSAELRFFRFSTQCNTPSILGYKSNMNSDKSFLINYILNYNKENSAVFQDIRNYLLICEELSIEEKNKIKQGKVSN